MQSQTVLFYNFRRQGEKLQAPQVKTRLIFYSTNIFKRQVEYRIVHRNLQGVNIDTILIHLDRV
jgi:hypothetical protein